MTGKEELSQWTVELQEAQLVRRGIPSARDMVDEEMEGAKLLALFASPSSCDIQVPSAKMREAL